MNVLQQLKKWFTTWGLQEDLIDPLAVGAALLLLSLIVVLSYWLARRLLLRGVHRLVERSRTKWDDMLMNKNFFSYLAHLAPAIVLQVTAPYFFPKTALIEVAILRGTNIYMVLMVVLVIFALLHPLQRFFERREGLRDQPIGSYFQLARIIIGLIGGILILSIALDKSPVFFLSTFGAMTAIILLVFRDTILGFVASIQIAANDMVHIGDWVEIPKHNADGNVIAITLATIKIRNWDKTISSVPTYAFISDSFTNWQGMKASGGRRIMRSLLIKVSSVRFCQEEDMTRFRTYQLLSDWIAEQDGRADTPDASLLINAQPPTNIGLFRQYAMAYLKQHPDIHQRPDMLLMVRQLAPTEHGLPLQVYCFTKTTIWSEYETIQADIFDHLLAAVSWFDLELFELPTSLDFGNR